MKNLMLDIETMGTQPGCAIVSIGAVCFEPETGLIGAKFYTSVNLKSCVQAGLKIEPDTVMWWLRQNEAAREKLIEGMVSLADALHLFKMFCVQNEVTQVWGNSASFDCSILRHAYKSLNMMEPWMYIHEKCYRTVVKLWPGNYPKKNPLRAHDPVYDCEYQIGILYATLKSLKSKNYI